MLQNLHQIHIPVMGTGHSIDSPIRLAHLGINSVISMVDDLLCEKIRKHYCKEFYLPYTNIPRPAHDGRAKRITAYLDMVSEIVNEKFDELKRLNLLEESEKDRYFNLLPQSNPLKSAYQFIESLTDAEMRDRLTRESD